MLACPVLIVLGGQLNNVAEHLQVHVAIALRVLELAW